MSLSSLPSLFASSIPLPDALASALRILTESRTPEAFLQHMADQGARSRCAVAWSGDQTYYYYTCQSCQVGSGSCVCVDCFNGSDHVGHEGVVLRTITDPHGAFCDCGDSSAEVF